MWPITAERAVIIAVPHCSRGSLSDLSIPQHLKQTWIQYSHDPHGAFLLTQTKESKSCDSSLSRVHRDFSPVTREKFHPQRFSPSAPGKRKLTVCGTGATCAVKKVH